MSKVKIFRFPFTPQTFVRTVRKDKIWFQIPEDKIENKDGLRRKKRIMRYNDYKNTLGGYAKEKRFRLPMSQAGVFFFIPIPLRWTKKQREQMHYSEHCRKPDLSNLLKAFEDSLVKKDEAIHHYAGLGKYWVDTLYKDENGKKRIGAGWIEVHMNIPVYDPIAGRRPTYIDAAVTAYDKIIKSGITPQQLQKPIQMELI